MKNYKKLFRSPYSVPNGLQMTEDGLLDPSTRSPTV